MEACPILRVITCPTQFLRKMWNFIDIICHLAKDYSRYTVKRVDEVVRHPHLVTQDQNTQVSNKVFDIPEENFTINIELIRHFSQVSN
jgi:predicted RNA-binding protein